VLSETAAINQANTFIEKNKKFLGITNLAAIEFGRAELSTGIYWDGAGWWYMDTKNQKADTIDVLNTNIRINIKNQEVVVCVGHWYPSIYIPNKFEVNQDKAKAILVNRIEHHSTFAGVDYPVKISQQDLEASKVRLKIYPVETDKKIQLHVTWEINIPAPVYYLIYVDVMTGEIISEQPTIIS
jgi:Zn-dependent metalloprotease